MTPLAELAGAKEPPVAVQFTEVSTAWVTVACTPAVRPTLTLVAVLRMELITTVCGVTVFESSAKSPAASVARSQKVLAAVSAGLVMGVPLTGVVEMSLAPAAVPIDALVAPE